MWGSDTQGSKKQKQARFTRQGMLLRGSVVANELAVEKQAGIAKTGLQSVLKPKYLGNGTGCPGVFQGNPCPYPSEPVPVHKGTGFDTYGLWVGCNPRVSKPVWDRNPGLHVYDKKAIYLHIYNLIISKDRWKPGNHQRVVVRLVGGDGG